MSEIADSIENAFDGYCAYFVQFGNECNVDCKTFRVCQNVKRLIDELRGEYSEERMFTEENPRP